MEEYLYGEIINAVLFVCLGCLICFILLFLFALFTKSGVESKGVDWKGTYGTVCVPSDVCLFILTTNYKLQVVVVYVCNAYQLGSLTVE